MTNTIVWGNEMYQIQTDQSARRSRSATCRAAFPAQAIAVDPCFLSPSGGPGIEYDGSAANWGLQSTSPCINVGTQVQNLPVTDLAGAASPQRRG